VLFGQRPSQLPHPHVAPQAAYDMGAGARRFQPRSVRFELAPDQGGVLHRFLAYSFPSRSPGPAHLTVLNRPGFVRAALALPSTTGVRLPSARTTVRNDRARASRDRRATYIVAAYVAGAAR